MNVLRFSLRISSILSFLLLLALGTHAHYRAGISGTVTDAQGGVVSERQSDCHGQGNRCLPAGHHRCQQGVLRHSPDPWSLYRYRGKARLQAGGTRQSASCCRPDESSEPNSIGPGPDFPNVGPLPGPPGTSCNGFRGPRYTDVDATLSKSFGLPSIKFLGERANLEIRANFYNLFNNLNLSRIDATISDSAFGEAQDVVGGRTIEMQVHFSF